MALRKGPSISIRLETGITMGQMDKGVTFLHLITKGAGLCLVVDSGLSQQGRSLSLEVAPFYCIQSPTCDLHFRVRQQPDERPSVDISSCSPSHSPGARSCHHPGRSRDRQNHRNRRGLHHSISMAIRSFRVYRRRRVVYPPRARRVRKNCPIVSSNPSR